MGLYHLVEFGQCEEWLAHFPILLENEARAHRLAHILLNQDHLDEEQIGKLLFEILSLSFFSEKIANRLGIEDDWCLFAENSRQNLRFLFTFWHLKISMPEHLCQMRLLLLLFLVLFVCNRLFDQMHDDFVEFWSLQNTLGDDLNELLQLLLTFVRLAAKVYFDLLGVILTILSIFLGCLWYLLDRQKAVDIV